MRDQLAPGEGLCAVTRRLPGPALDRLAAEREVRIWPGEGAPGPGELAALAKGAAGLITTVEDGVGPDLMDACPNLRAIANYGVGYDNIDVAAAATRGIAVGNTPDVLTDATAELAFALLAAVARRVAEADSYVRAGRWRAWEPNLLLGKPISGATLAIIGPGRIGTALARRAAGFGMNVATHGRRDGPEHLEAVLATSDYVSLHCPLTPETRHLVDARSLAAMKPGAVLVNTARGGLVDLDALADALQSGHLGGAGLDTADPEPIDLGHPIMAAPRVVFTPHIGSATRQAREAMADLAVENILLALRAEPMAHPVPPPRDNPPV
jgi:glyoxylate reductase